MANGTPNEVDELIERIRGVNVSDDTAEQPPKVLEEVSVAGIVKHIKKIQSQNETRKILVMTGAGISTAAGIPDFRTPGSGLYDNLQKYNLPSPEAIFHIDYFTTNPKPFYHLAKEMYPGNFKPTLSHYFIRLLERKNLLLRSFTQNIDTLERQAGISAESIVEAHGSFSAAHCITCKAEYTPEYVKDKVFKDQLPVCTKDGCANIPEEIGSKPCEGLIKPDIVFFGESLPERFGQLAGKDTRECDLLIVMGTSLAVHPFASLADRVREDCPRLLINLEKVGDRNPLMMLLGINSGFDFSDGSYRDVFLQGTCDDGVKELARHLGWEDELMRLYEEDHHRLDLEMSKENSSKPE